MLFYPGSLSQWFFSCSAFCGRMQENGFSISRRMRGKRDPLTWIRMCTKKCMQFWSFLWPCDFDGKDPSRQSRWSSWWLCTLWNISELSRNILDPKKISWNIFLKKQTGMKEIPFQSGSHFQTLFAGQKMCEEKRKKKREKRRRNLRDRVEQTSFQINDLHY